MTRIYFLLIASLLPSLGMANGLSLTPSGSDVTVSCLLNQLFGSLTGISGGGMCVGTFDPLAGVISKFNEVILLVGGILVTYTLIAGTMQTAHDGEVLGKKWSSMWVPIRTSLGIAAIVPVVGGYGVIQAVVMWMVLQGVGAANTLWTLYTSSATAYSSPSISLNYKQGAEMAATVLKQQMCVVTINSEFAQANRNSMANGGVDTSDIYGQATVKNLATPIGNGGTSAGLNHQNVCGSYLIQPPVPVANLGSWFGSTFNATNFSTAIANTHATAFTQLQQDIGVLAQEIYASAYQPTYSTASMAVKYGAGIDRYNQTLNSAIQGHLTSLDLTNNVAQNASRDGWGMAGAWYMKFAYIKSELSKATQNYPRTNPPVTASVDSAFKQAFTDYQARADEITTKASYANELGIRKQAQEERESDSKIMNMIAKAFDYDLTSGYIANQFDTKDPIIAAKDLGDTIFNWSVGAIGVIVGGATVGGSIPLIGGGIQAAATLAGPFVFAVIGSFIGFSAVLAFYLPLLPFLIWFGIILGWIIMVVEAIIAAPMWAMSHLYPDGDGIVGRGGQGYSLVLALTLRPALAVLGLIASIAILIPVGKVFAATFWSVSQITNGTGFTGPFVFLATIVIFVTTFVALIKRVFALSHVIPDQILQWIGGPSGNLGQYGGDLGNASAGGSAAVGGVMGGLGGQSLSTVQNARQLAETRKGKEAQERANEMQQRRATAQQMDQRQATTDSFASLGMEEEGKGIVAAQMAGETKRDEALANAQKSLKADTGPDGKAFRLAEKQGDVTHMNNALWDKVKEQNGGVRGGDGRVHGGTNPSEIAATERNRVYGEWREQPSRRENGTIADTYSDAISKYQAAKSAAENGQNISQSAPPVQPTKPPPTDPNAGV